MILPLVLALAAAPAPRFDAAAMMGLKRLADPQLSPDGRLVAYQLTEIAMPEGGRSTDIWIASSDPESAAAPRRLTDHAAADTRPRWSPDGRRIAFVSTRDGNSEIYEMGIDGGEARRLTKSGERESSPRYLPTGDLIYVVERGNNARVMRLAADTSSPLPLLEIDKPVVAFAVSRDGERIAYVAGKLSESGKGKSQLTLRVQALASGSAPVLVPLHPGEQVLSPAF